jgi:hypothetical protein
VLTLPKDQKASSQVVDLRIQGGARTITFLESGREQFEAIIIGKDTYVKISPAALKIPDWLSVPKHFTGRWLKVSRNRLNLGSLQHWSPATVAAILANHGPLDPVVRQATLHGRKVVVVTDRENGGKLYVADTGTAYPLLIANPDGRQIECTDYGANFHITAPRNALPEP